MVPEYSHENKSWNIYSFCFSFRHLLSLQNQILVLLTEVGKLMFLEGGVGAHVFSICHICQLTKV